jgi:hypothetical protein
VPPPQVIEKEDRNQNPKDEDDDGGGPCTGHRTLVLTTFQIAAIPSSRSSLSTSGRRKCLKAVIPARQPASMRLPSEERKWMCSLMCQTCEEGGWRGGWGRKEG